MRTFFVTATGTEIGKTFVAAGLLRHFRGVGLKACAIKPVLSGFVEENMRESDPVILLAAMDQKVSRAEIARISPWRFAAPLSPNMAAAREGRVIDFNQVVDFCRKEVSANGDLLLIEGIGGTMVPLDRHHTTLDLMAELGVPVLLVTGTYLGTLSHTLTALEVLKTRDLRVALLVINESEDGLPPSEIQATLKHFCGDIETAILKRNPGEAGFAKLAHHLA